jgi:AcrR family transcriptional regulator
MIEADGIDQLTLAKLATQLGVKAASLYRYFDSKNALLQSINTQTVTQLIQTVRSAVDGSPQNVESRLLAISIAYREFAHSHPVTYGLAMGQVLPDISVNADYAEQLALPLQAMFSEYIGAPNSLAALRGALALMHGFVTLELAGQFRRGGNIDEAFALSVRAYLAGLKMV